MVPDNTPATRSAMTQRHQTRRLRAAVRYVAQGMRELEEQLPLPVNRRVRDATPARQKATAIRDDFGGVSLRLTQLSRQLKAMTANRE